MSTTIRSMLGVDDDLQTIADRELDFGAADVGAYSIRVYRDGQQGAAGVEGFEKLDQPVSPESWEATVEADGLERGDYRLLALAGEEDQHRILGTVWSVECGVEPPERQDVDEQLAALRRQVDQLEEPRISTPDEAMGAILVAALEGDVDLGSERVRELITLARVWTEIRRETPDSPDALCAMIGEALLRSGELEAATALLSAWFEAQDVETSLLDAALEGTDLDDVDLSSVAALGVLRTLDEPDRLAGLFEQGRHLAAPE